MPRASSGFPFSEESSVGIRGSCSSVVSCVGASVTSCVGPGLALRLGLLNSPVGVGFCVTVAKGALVAAVTFIGATEGEEAAAGFVFESSGTAVGLGPLHDSLPLGPNTTAVGGAWP